MLFEIESKKSLDEIGRALEAAAARHQFGVLAVHNLKEKMREKGVEFSGDCLVYEVCNPLHAKQVLEANGAISTALPCRISIYRAGNAYRIATLRPTALLRMFGDSSLDAVARQVEDTLVAIMAESA